MNALGCVVSGAVLLRTSNIPFVVAGPEPFLTPFLASIANELAQLVEGDDELFATYIAALLLITICTGAAFALAGRLQLLRFADYLPYPVLCAFLAQIGILLLKLGIEVATYHPRVHPPPQRKAEQAACGCLVAILLTASHVMGLKPIRGMAVIVVSSALLFFVVLAATGRDIQDAQRNGWQ